MLAEAIDHQPCCWNIVQVVSRVFLIESVCKNSLHVLYFSCSPSAMAPKLMKMIRVEAPLLREIMAEFLGTFLLVVSWIHLFFSLQSGLIVQSASTRSQGHFVTSISLQQDCLDKWIVLFLTRCHTENALKVSSKIPLGFFLSMLVYTFLLLFPERDRVTSHIG